MQETPKGDRLHIGIFGRRNAGKSSLINALTNQDVALVSEHPGTTTDPVYKAMEILPIGPVMLVDTAGIDDTGDVGKLRIERTKRVLNKIDLALLVVDATVGWEKWELELYNQILGKGVPLIIVINKADLKVADQTHLPNNITASIVAVSSYTGEGIDNLKDKLTQTVPDEFLEQKIIGDLLKPNDIVILVTPIDSAAPKGRLILPQVQVLRDILDSGATAMVCQEEQVAEAIANLKKPPRIVVTDSQAFETVARQTPPEIMLTSFSILFARHKGNLKALVEGAKTIKQLKPGDKVLISEGCTHHRQTDDIGKVKIPRWLNKTVGGQLEYHWTSGGGFPEDLSSYKLIIHCGACMLNRREMLHRIQVAYGHKIPIVNYGVFIAYYNGILPRTLEPLLNIQK